MLREAGGTVRRCRYDQLPLVADGPPPEQAPGRVVHVDERVGKTLAEHLLPRRHRLRLEQVDAWQAGRRLDAAGGQHRRHEVDRTGQGVAGSRYDRARLAEHDRRPQAAVVGRQLRPGRKPSRVGLLEPAVVGDIDDQCVCRELLTVQVVEQIADRAVEAFDIPPIPRDVNAVGLRRVVIDQFLRGIVGIVGQHGGIPDHERSAILPAAGHEVVDRLHGLPADREPVVTVPSPLRHPLGEPPARKIPLPPLPGLEAAVAMLAQQPGKCRPFLQMPVHPFATGLEGGLPFGRATRVERILRWIVADDPMLVRIAAGDDRRQARAAETAGHIAATKDEALPCEPVEVRRAELPMAHERIVAPMLVVRDDEDDVAGRGRPGRLRFGRHPARCHAVHDRDDCRQSYEPNQKVAKRPGTT